ncbi:MAG TPA: peptidoglycan recognition protein [Acidimicrobiales bacterium]|nr:peptidoglycan recognition protein [Acidimicrobiales bacterium]
MRLADRRRRATALAVALVLTVAMVGVLPAPAIGRPRAMGVDTRPVAAVARLTSLESFRLVGLSWRGRHDADVRVRVHRADGWSPWMVLHGEADEGPDPAERARAGAARTATGPVWVDRADGLQIDAPPLPSLRVHLVRERGAIGSAFRPAGRPAAANVARPGIALRDTWLARPPRTAPTIADGVKVAFVHHTVGNNTYASDDVPSLLRGMQAFHMDANGWDDIGYNLLVDRFGRVWEGRDGGVDQAVVGAQVEGLNTGSTGVAVLGDFTSTDPSPHAIEAVGRLLAWKLPAHGTDPAGRSTLVSKGNDRYPTGTPVELANISGHRDGKATGCPGQRLYDRLGTIRADAAWGAAAVLAYGPSWRGGVFAASAELDLDGVPEIVTGADRGGSPHVRTFDPDGTARKSFLGFGEAFRGGVRVAAGNVDGIGPDELVLGAGPGGGPHVRIVTEENVEIRSFFAYPSSFAGGVYVATGDVDGLPGDEIVTGPGPGSRPEVRVFRLDGSLLHSFDAFTLAFRGGVRVATADVDGDGVAEIVAGAGPGGGPQVRVFGLDGNAVAEFMAFAEAFRGGVHVAGLQSEHGHDLLAVGAGEGGGPQVRVFGSDGTVRSQFFAGRPSSTTGARVASGRFTGGGGDDDGGAEIITAPGPGGPPLVRISRRNGSLVFPS